jgi:hypothetical protein
MYWEMASSVEMYREMASSVTVLGYGEFRDYWEMVSSVNVLGDGEFRGNVLEDRVPRKCTGT